MKTTAFIAKDESGKLLVLELAVDIQPNDVIYIGNDTQWNKHKVISVDDGKVNTVSYQGAERNTWPEFISCYQESTHYCASHVDEVLELTQIIQNSNNTNKRQIKFNEAHLQLQKHVGRLIVDFGAIIQDDTKTLEELKFMVSAAMESLGDFLKGSYQKLK